MAELHAVMRAGQAGQDLGRPRGCSKLRVVVEDHEKQQCAKESGQETGDARRAGQGQVTQGLTRNLAVLRTSHRRMLMDE